jgi:biotin carboxyl carrier protein
MSVKKAAEEKAVEKKTSAKKPAAEKAVKPAAKKAVAAVAEAAAEKKPAARKTATKKTAEVVIQSPLGGEITGAEILARVGNVDKVYVRVDENKAYWVRGEESGSVDLW